MRHQALHSRMSPDSRGSMSSTSSSPRRHLTTLYLDGNPRMGLKIVRVRCQLPVFHIPAASKRDYLATCPSLGFMRNGEAHRSGSKNISPQEPMRLVDLNSNSVSPLFLLDYLGKGSVHVRGGEVGVMLVMVVGN